MRFEWYGLGALWGRVTGGGTGSVASVAVAVVVGFALVAPLSSHAAFSQSFGCQIKPGTNGVPSSFVPLGVAVDVPGNLWVVGGGKLDEFNSSCAFLGPKPGPEPLSLEESLTRPESLAVERSTGHFYVTGGGTRASSSPPYVEVFDGAGKKVKLKEWEEKEVGFGAHVAVDSSTEPLKDPSACGTSPLLSSECFVYVAHDSRDPAPPYGEGLPKGIEKFSASGTPVNFTSSGSCVTPTSYVKGHEITGTPSEESFGYGAPESIAVDSFGNIYAVNQAQEEVDEYGPCGKFLGKFTGGDTPGLGGSRENGGFGGSFGGVAIDPASGLLAVSVYKSFFSEPANDQGAVDEFDPSSGKFLNQITETSAGAHLHLAFQVTFDSQGDLYVVDGLEHTVDVYGPGRFVPGFRLAEASERAPESAVLNGRVNPESPFVPENPGLTECFFQYVTEEAFKKEGFSKSSTSECVPLASAILANDEYQAVHAGISSLEPGVTYYYRLAAVLAGKFGGATGYSEPVAFTAPHAPRVDSTSATNPSSTFVDLRAQVDPLGADTTYRFEYVEEADYNSTGYANAKATPMVDIGSGGPTGSADASVVQHIGGLEPATTYHFRVVAKSESGTTEAEGPEDLSHKFKFTTLPRPVPGLPDNRAYELVTPPNKGSAADMFAYPERNEEFLNHDHGYPAESGDAFLLETNSAFGPFPATEGNVYVFRRDREKREWTYTSLASRSLGVQRISSPVFNPADLSSLGFIDTVGSSASEAGAHPMSLVGSPGGPYTTVISRAEASDNVFMVGASHDLSHLVIENFDHTLAPGAEGQDARTPTLYEWDGVGECGVGTSNCKVVNVKPDGSVFQCGALLGQGYIPGAMHNAVSYDGSKVFFTAPDPVALNEAGAGCWKKATKENPPELYMRSGGVTVGLSEPETSVSDPTGPHPAIYVGAAEDGSRVFFVTETELTNDSAKLKLHDPELYEWEADGTGACTQAKGCLTHISAGEEGSPVTKPGSSGAHVFTVPAVSAHGSAVYFTAFGRLVSGLRALESGQVYIYRYNTGTGATTYVATVGEADYPDQPVGGAWWAEGKNAGLGRNGALVSAADWYTTPDGRYLLFATTSELIGYSTVTAPGHFCFLAGTQAEHNGHCDELYRYHYEPESESGGSVVCVSCDPSGAPPVSNAEFARSPLEGNASGPVRGMSDDGSMVFLDTVDGLVSRDENKTLDVYEWHDGRISLLSSGQDHAPSFFLGASADGSNVFFGTHARLAPQDSDTNGDLFDARICTASDPCIKPPPGETAQCGGDTCQTPPPAPIDATPGSLTFSGAGNVSLPGDSLVKPRSLTRAQQLAKALKACRKKRKSQRKRCESQARKRYGKKAKGSARARHAKTNRRAGR